MVAWRACGEQRRRQVRTVTMRLASRSHCLSMRGSSATWSSSGTEDTTLSVLAPTSTSGAYCRAWSGGVGELGRGGEVGMNESRYWGTMRLVRRPRPLCRPLPFPC